MGGIFCLKLKVYLGFIPLWNVKGTYISIKCFGEDCTITNGSIGPITTGVLTMAFMK